jgi:hypothetical protein
MPETKTENDRANLRDSHQVRLVETSEAGFAADRLPHGVYGFTGAPQEGAIPLFDKKNWHSFEIHRLADGSLHLVGYVSPKDANLIRSGEHVAVTLFPDPWEDAGELISVALARMVPSKRGPSREGGNGLPLELL